MRKQKTFNQYNKKEKESIKMRIMEGASDTSSLPTFES